MIYHKRCLSTQWFCGLAAHEAKAPGMGQKKACKTEAAQEELVRLVRLRQHT